MWSLIPPARSWRGAEMSVKLPGHDAKHRAQELGDGFGLVTEGDEDGRSGPGVDEDDGLQAA